MAISVTKLNTKVLDLGGGWIKISHDTGEKRTEAGPPDADGKPTTVQVPIVKEATLTRASIEVSAGVLLPKVRVKAIAEVALNAQETMAPTEIAGL